MEAVYVMVKELSKTNPHPTKKRHILKSLNVYNSSFLYRRVCGDHNDKIYMEKLEVSTLESVMILC